MAVSSFLFPTQHQGHIMSDTTLIFISGFVAIVKSRITCSIALENFYQIKTDQKC